MKYNTMDRYKMILIENQRVNSPVDDPEYEVPLDGTDWDEED